MERNAPWALIAAFVLVGLAVGARAPARGGAAALAGTDRQNRRAPTAAVRHLTQRISAAEPAARTASRAAV